MGRVFPLTFWWVPVNCISDNVFVFTRPQQIPVLMQVLNSALWDSSNKSCTSKWVLQTPNLICVCFTNMQAEPRNWKSGSEPLPDPNCHCFPNLTAPRLCRTQAEWISCSKRGKNTLQQSQQLIPSRQWAIPGMLWFPMVCSLLFNPLGSQSIPVPWEFLVSFFGTSNAESSCETIQKRNSFQRLYPDLCLFHLPHSCGNSSLNGFKEIFALPTPCPELPVEVRVGWPDLFLSSLSPQCLHTQRSPLRLGSNQHFCLQRWPFHLLHSRPWSGNWQQPQGPGFHLLAFSPFGTGQGLTSPRCCPSAHTWEQLLRLCDTNFPEINNSEVPSSWIVEKNQNFSGH